MWIFHDPSVQSPLLSSQFFSFKVLLLVPPPHPAGRPCGAPVHCIHPQRADQSVSLLRRVWEPPVFPWDHLQCSGSETIPVTSCMCYILMRFDQLSRISECPSGSRYLLLYFGTVPVCTCVAGDAVQHLPGWGEARIEIKLKSASFVFDIYNMEHSLYLTLKLFLFSRRLSIWINGYICSLSNKTIKLLNLNCKIFDDNFTIFSPVFPRWRSQNASVRARHPPETHSLQHGEHTPDMPSSQSLPVGCFIILLTVFLSLAVLELLDHFPVTDWQVGLWCRPAGRLHGYLGSLMHIVLHTC